MGSGRERALEKAFRHQKPVTRVFLDANILFSAARFEGSRFTAFILRSESWDVRCLYSPLVLEETIRNLKKKHPGGLKDLGPLLAKMELVPQSAEGPCPIPLPAKDQHVLLAAIAGKADVLLTGDIKDFGPFMNKPKQSAGILIQTFAQFVAEELKTR
jgi:predicted nucleic acid-binding protein